MICEVQRVAKARKTNGGGTHRVLVVDDIDEIRLEVGDAAYPAGLSAAQARTLARVLIAAANKLDQRKNPAKK